MFYAWNVFIASSVIIGKDSLLDQKLGRLGAYRKTIGFIKYAIGIPEVYETEEEMLTSASDFTKINVIRDALIKGKVKCEAPFRIVPKIECIQKFGCVPKKIEHFTIAQKKLLYKRLKEEFPLAWVQIIKHNGTSFIDVDFLFSEGNTAKLEKICKIFNAPIIERYYNWGTSSEIQRYVGKYIICKTYSEYGSPLPICWSDYYEIPSFYGKNEEDVHRLEELDPLDWKGPFGEEVLVTSWREIWDSS